jgi:hypothetical protein
MYTEAEPASSLFDRHRSKRGTIQPGAKLSTSCYVKEVFEDQSQVQRAAAIAVAKRVGIRARNNFISGDLLAGHSFHLPSWTQWADNHQERRFGTTAASNTLPQSMGGGRAHVIEMEKGERAFFFVLFLRHVMP